MDADLVVVGAGPAGAATALFAARAGLRVTILDQASFPRDKPCGEGLLPPGRAVLSELGVEEALVEGGAPSLEGIAFGPLGGPRVPVPFPGGTPGLGVRRLRFDQALIDRVQEDPRITFHPGTRVEVIQRGPQSPPRVVWATGELRPRFVAVADGLRSGLRHQLGWTVGPRRPHRFGVVGHWRTDSGQAPWIRITLTDGIELYEAPVASDERLVALLCDRPRMKQFGGQTTAAYEGLCRSLSAELDTATREGPVSAIGPFRYRASTVAQDGVFLVGDAAGFVDPISGEGLASGLRQARAAAAAMTQPAPERVYRQAHRSLTLRPRQATALLVYLAARPSRVARGMRGLEHAPALMTKLIGVVLGEWGFSALTPREWLALATGR